MILPQNDFVRGQCLLFLHRVVLTAELRSRPNSMIQSVSGTPIQQKVNSCEPLTRATIWYDLHFFPPSFLMTLSLKRYNSISIEFTCEISILNGVDSNFWFYVLMNSRICKRRDTPFSVHSRLNSFFLIQCHLNTWKKRKHIANISMTVLRHMSHNFRPDREPLITVQWLHPLLLFFSYLDTVTKIQNFFFSRNTIISHKIVHHR